MKRLCGLAIMAPAFVLAWAGNVLAGDTFCPPAAAVPATINNLIADGFCVLIDKIIRGNAKAEPGADLRLLETTVVGNVQGEGAAVAVNFGSVIGGDVKCVQTTGQGCIVQDSVIVGDLQVVGSLEGQFDIRETVVGGNVQVFDNVTPVFIGGGGGDPVIILGDLLCEGNSGLVALFAGNVVVIGNRGGQCSP